MLNRHSLTRKRMLKVQIKLADNLETQARLKELLRETVENHKKDTKIVKAYIDGNKRRGKFEERSKVMKTLYAQELLSRDEESLNQLESIWTNIRAIPAT